MNKKFFLVLGIGVVALGYMFNLGYAADDYGMVKNSLSLSIIAQSGSSGDGSGSGSGGGSGGVTGEGEGEEDDDEITCTTEISIDTKGYLKEGKFIITYFSVKKSCDFTKGTESECEQGSFLFDDPNGSYVEDEESFNAEFETIDCTPDD